MDTVGALLAHARDRDGVAFDAPERSTGHSFREFVTDAWKTGNLLRHYGVREGAEVAVVVGPKRPELADDPGRLGDAVDPLLASLGALCLGARLDLAPDETVDAAALVLPAAWLDRYDPAPGCTRLAYGDPPADPTVNHFEGERWSENPVAPPDRVSGEAVTVDGGPTQHELLEEGRRVVESAGLSAGDRVALAGPLSAGNFAAAVVAPLLAGATLVGGDGSGDVEVGADGRVSRI